MKAKKKIPLSLSAAAVLLSLVLISAHFTSGMYARYVASASGSDSGRLAGFRVAAKAESETPVTITAGERENEYQVLISNPGEVAVSYEASVSFEEGLTDQPKVTITREGYAEPGTETLKGFLAPGADETLTVSFDLSEQFSGDQAGGLDFQNGAASGQNGEIPFEVVVIFAQVG